jgi:hypothetical protein
LIRYGLTAIATLAAGPVLERYGWRNLNLVILPLLLIAAAMTLVWVRSLHAPGGLTLKPSARPSGK